MPVGGAIGVHGHCNVAIAVGRMPLPFVWPLPLALAVRAVLAVPLSGPKRASMAPMMHSLITSAASRRAPLERIAGVDILAVDPRLAVLPVDVVAQQHLVHLVNVGVVGEHDVAGEVEREAVLFDRPAPAADPVVLLQQQRIFAQVIGGAEPGRPGPDNDDGRAEPRAARSGLSAVTSETAACVNQVPPWLPRSSPMRSGRARRASSRARSSSILGGAQGTLAGGDKLLRRVAQVDNVAIGFGDVGDRRADDGLLGRHVFQGLGRADEAGGLVAGERQQADVPAGEIGGQDRA